jgi:hypothetical protein
MPTVTGTAIIDAAAVALQDLGGTRWTRPELLDYLNAGQRALVVAKPNAYVRLTDAPLVAGTVQTLPVADGTAAMEPIQLVAVLRNSCNGLAVRLVERHLLDLHMPDWHARPRTKVVKHYCYNPLDPKRFLVYPPNDGTGCLEIACAATPPTLPSEEATIALDDIYRDALLDYCLYRAFAKDAEYAADPARAAAHYAAFTQALTTKTGHEQAESPIR